MYQRFRRAVAGTDAEADETGPEMDGTGCIGGAGGGATTAEGAEGVESTGVATLTDELRPESSSRFSRFKSPRISDATW
jgi:hypothetical protein